MSWHLQEIQEQTRHLTETLSLPSTESGREPKIKLILVYYTIPLIGEDQDKCAFSSKTHKPLSTPYCGGLYAPDIVYDPDKKVNRSICKVNKPLWDRDHVMNCLIDNIEASVGLSFNENADSLKTQVRPLQAITVSTAL